MTEAENRQTPEVPPGGGPEMAPDVASGIRWRPFAAVIICLMVFDVTMGLSYPLLSLLLEGRGHSPFVIGLNASMLPLGLVLSAPFVPSLATRFGPWRFAMGCIAVTAILWPLFKIWDSLGAWFVLRFLLGIVEGGLFAISEVWINQLASGRNRGRVIAV